METVFISKTTNESLPKWPYQAIKDDILGKKYQLSLSFIGTVRAQKLNQVHRNKQYVPNVLSFPLGSNMGEIYLCQKAAAPQARDFNLSARGYIAYLFIHGCVHLKGHDHGDAMDKLERYYLRKYSIV